MKTEICSNGFGGKVVRTELSFVIEHHLTRGRGGFDGEPFRVHMFHGTPAYADWFKNRAPIKCFATIDKAQEMVDTLGGLVDTHKHFPIVQTNW